VARESSNDFDTGQLRAMLKPILMLKLAERYCSAPGAIASMMMDADKAKIADP
jgi:hypothetical protein